MSLHSLDDEITDFTPNQKLADYFNTKEYFYSYDSATIMSHLAALAVKALLFLMAAELKKNYLNGFPYGVAIGLDDLERANKTLLFFRPWWENKEEEELNLVKKIYS